jgi:polar amino acid transport system substrate-binding protein
MKLASLLGPVLAAACLAGCAKEPSRLEANAAPAAGAPLRVGVEAKYEPFETVNAQHEFIGFDIDLAREAAKSLGRSAEFKDMDWPSLIPELQAGRIDMICSGMSWTAERAEIVDFTKPYAQSPMSVLVNVELAKGVEKAAQLDDPAVRIAVQRGTTGAKKAMAAFPKAKFTEFDDENEAATEVGTGRCTAFVYDYVSVAKYARQYPVTTRVLDESLGAEDYCIAVAKGSPLRAQIDAFLDGAKGQDGVLQRLMEKWLPGAAEKLRTK